MKALILCRYGAPDVLEIADVPTPSAGLREVLLRLHVSGVNPIDAGVRAGRVLPDEPSRFPMVLGWDRAGIVEEVSGGVDGLRAGDRVMAISKQPSSGVGLHAQFAVLPVEQVVPIPPEVSLEAAAATPLAAITALNAVEALRLGPGARVHINNPAGAVGRFAVQIAEALGLDVVDASASGSVDGAVDVRGGTAAHATFAAVKDGGAFVTVIPQWWKPGGIYTEARGIKPVVVENAPTREDPARLAAWLAEGRLTPDIEAVLPLADGAEAHRRLEAPGLTRKLVLDHGN